MRLASAKALTRAMANMPTLFAEIRQPKTNYLALPRVSSERCAFIPIAHASSNLIAGDKLQTIPNASLYEFGVIASSMHMAWMRTTAGRLKSDFQYSAKITYNNFPWPDCRSDALVAPTKSINAIEVVAQAVLDARAVHIKASLADYSPCLLICSKRIRL